MSAGGSCVFRRRSGKRRAGAGRLCREDRRSWTVRRWRRWSAALPYTGTEGSASAISFPGSATGCLMSAVLRSQRPAHGGRDPGKVAVNQTEEKDLNLEIALKLKNQLEKKGITVVMTRETDAGLYEENAQNKQVQDLQRRCQLIQDTGPACAVSIHQNSYSDESVKGAQVFYYRSSAKGQELAEQIQAALREYADPDNKREAKGDATYYMLKNTAVPLVIVECGFLSNWEEAELLKEEAYQNTLAEAVAEGIGNYLEKKA